MRYAELYQQIRKTPRTWLTAGVAGFIGCNLLETLLMLDQRAVGLDNLATGHRRNLEEIQCCVTAAQWTRFRFVEGDIRKLDDCRQSCDGVEAMEWYVDRLE